MKQVQKRNSRIEPKEKFEYLIATGNKYLSTQQFSVAKHQFREAILINPYDFSANLGFVTAYVNECLEYDISCENAEY